MVDGKSSILTHNSGLQFDLILILTRSFVRSFAFSIVLFARSSCSFLLSFACLLNHYIQSFTRSYMHFLIYSLIAGSFANIA